MTQPKTKEITIFVIFAPGATAQQKASAKAAIAAIPGVVSVDEFATAELSQDASLVADQIARKIEQLPGVEQTVQIGCNRA